MNASKITAHKENTAKLNADEDLMADYEALVEICTKAIVDGYGTLTMLANAKPLLTALYRVGGIDPTWAVEAAKEDATLAALRIKEESK